MEWRSQASVIKVRTDISDKTLMRSIVYDQSFLQQSLTFFHTRSTILPSNCPEAEFDCLFEVEGFSINDSIQSVAVEVSLYDTEDRFDWIILGGVAHVEDRFDVQLRIPRSDLLRSVHG